MSRAPKKKRHENTSAPARKVPEHADYCDDVSEEHMRRIREAVKDENVDEAEVVSGPAW